MRLGSKMMIAFTVMLAIAFGVGGSVLIYTSTSNTLSQSRDAAVSSHRLILYTLSAVSGGIGGGSVLPGGFYTYRSAFGVSGHEYDELVAVLTQLDSQSGHNRVYLRLSDSSRTVYQSHDNDKYVKDLSDSSDDGHYAMMMFRDSDGAHLLQISGRLLFGAQTLVLESVYDISSVYTGRQYQQSIYRQLFAAVVILGAAASWLMSFFMTLPLRKLSRVTRTIASGDLSCRAHADSRDEIGVLAADFNYMAERLEENINELRDTMLRQEEFMGGLAHELKTPMTSIIGYADLLRGHNLSDDDRRDAANYIFSEGRRLEVLSLKLLDLIVLKRSDFTFIPVSIAYVIESAAALLQPVLIKQSIQLTTDCRDVQCMIEPDLITSLLINLIDNSRKALDKGGRIHIKTDKDGGFCSIHVSDNGKGIPPGELTKIKDAFYRVDKSRSRSQGGVGLGLRLCDEIAVLHGGEILFESEQGKGTTVTVRLRGETAYEELS